MEIAMKANWDGLITVTLVACALVTTAVVVHRGVFAHAPMVASSTHQEPVFIKNWKSQPAAGIRLGSINAPVQLIEFADFECPFCRDLHKTLRALRERYSAQVSLVYIHFPLQGHRFALPAARVAECADEQGKFEPMYDQLFDGQDEFGLKPWSDFARAAGLSDLAAFESCIKRTTPVPRVEQGKQLGATIDVKGTPTLIINGWMLAAPPSFEELDAMVKAALAGKSPVSGRT
jgi:protein-disulfide isomerase